MQEAALAEYRGLKLALAVQRGRVLYLVAVPMHILNEVASGLRLQDVLPRVIDSELSLTPVGLHAEIDEAGLALSRAYPRDLWHEIPEFDAQLANTSSLLRELGGVQNHPDLLVAGGRDREVTPWPALGETPAEPHV